MISAAEASGELLWRLPIPEQTREAVAHREQDRRRAAAQLGALGVGAASPRRSSSSSSTDGPGRTSTSPARPGTRGGPWGHVPPGATGYGVTTLVELARQLAVDDERGARRRTERRLLGEASGASCCLLEPVVVAHPLRDADQPGVVRRDAVAVGELVRPLHRRDPPPGPLAVVGDQQQRHVGDRRARLDEALDTAAAPDEVEQVLLVGVVGRERDHARLAAARVAARGTDRADPWRQVCCIGTSRPHVNTTLVRSRRRRVVGWRREFGA